MAEQVEIIIAATEYGLSNDEIIPLVYYLNKSDLLNDSLDLNNFFLKGYRFIIVSVQSAVVFIFKNSEKEIKLQIDRENIISFEQLGYDKFEAKKISEAAARLKRAASVTPGSHALIPMLAIKGINKWLNSNKSEIHEGQIFLLYYEFEGKKISIKVACEKSYENDFVIFLTNHWNKNLH